MEPTIYKPSIYKGAGVYKAGAGGGGDFSGVLGAIYLKPESSQETVTLGKSFDKDDVSILVNFTSWSTSNGEVVRFLDDENATQLYYHYNNGYFIGDYDGSGGMILPGTQSNTNNSYIIHKNTGIGTNYYNLNGDRINNIRFSSGKISKMTIYKGYRIINKVIIYNGDAVTDRNLKPIMLLVPAYINGDSGFLDLVENVFLPVNNSVAF